MKERHYDLIILGDSLASSITAALLAKGGFRVLRFRDGATPPCPWPHSSLHLERLLDRLGGKSCLAPLSPLQVLTGTSRLDLPPPEPRETELEREFPGQSAAIGKKLSGLRILGEKLEKVLLETGGLPLFGPVDRARFLYGCLRLGLSRRVLNRPLKGFFAGIEGGAAQEALSALFAGLSLTSHDELSVAEGALLWSGACRMEAASPQALENLLEARYRQFYGEEAELDRIEDARVVGKRVVEITARGGEKYSADHFLLGAPGSSPRLPVELRAPSGFGGPPPLPQGAEIDGGVSPLLASRVILGDGPPLRLSLFKEGERTCCSLEGLTSDANLEERLRPALPFASLEPPPLSGREERGGGAKRKTFLKSWARLRLKRNLLLCHGGSLLPSLGVTGEVLLGMTLAERMLRSRARK